jgi:hypothetical protein
MPIFQEEIAVKIFLLISIVILRLIKMNNCMENKNEKLKEIVKEQYNEIALQTKEQILWLWT